MIVKTSMSEPGAKSGGRRILWLLLAGFAVLAIGLYLWLRPRQLEMSEPPARSAGAAMQIAPSKSVVVADLSVTYALLQQALNAKLQQIAGTVRDRKDLRCIRSDFPRFRECITALYQVSYAPAGTATVARDGSFVRVTIPMKFSGWAGFNGEIARLISARDKAFDGAFEISVSASLDFADNFCPLIVPGRVAFKWLSPARVEVVGDSSFRIAGVRFGVGPYHLDVSGFLTPAIRNALEEALANARTAIACEPVHAELQKLWRTHTIALPVNDVLGSKMHLNVEPLGMGSSALLAEQEQLRAIVSLSANVAVAPEPIAAKALPLPKHERLAPQPGVLDITLPLTVPYASFVALLAPLKGQAQQAHTPAGAVTVVLSDFEIYPVGDRVAIGVQFKADVPSSWADVQGKLWLVAEPTVEGNGSKVSLTDVQVFRSLDNPVWNALTAAFRNVINRQIEQHSKLDLAAQDAKLVVELQKALADPAKTGGVRLQIREPKVRLGTVHLDEQAMLVEVKTSAQWSAQLQQLSPAPGR